MVSTQDIPAFARLRTRRQSDQPPGRVDPWLHEGSVTEQAEGFHHHLQSLRSTDKSPSARLPSTLTPRLPQTTLLVYGASIGPSIFDEIVAMPPTRRRVGPPQVALAVARLLGWLASLATLLAIAYLVRRWPDKGGTAAAAFLGVAVAMLTDSWEMIAQLDPTYNFPPMKAPRAVMHDLFGLVVTVGGLMLMLFSDLREERAAQVDDSFDKGNDWNAKREVMDVAQWMLAIVACVATASAGKESLQLTLSRIMRFFFAIWSGCACTRARRQRQFRRHGRRRRRATEPTIMDLIRAGAAARYEEDQLRRRQQRGEA